MVRSRVREKALLGIGLAWIAGFVDAAGYLVLRRLFTAHMSGNSAALGAHLGRGEWHAAIRRAVPIPLFVLGIVVGSAIVEVAKRRRARAPLALALTGEAVLIGLFMITAPRLVGGRSFLVPTAFLAAAMGVQSATLRRAGRFHVRTTYVSGTLTNMAEDAVAGVFRIRDGRGGEAALRRAALSATVYAGFLCGAVTGAAIQSRLGHAVFGIPLGALALIVARDFARPLDIRRPGTV